MDTGAGFTGTARADTFTATNTTLNAGDNLVGGDGTDTLQITSNATGAVAVGGDALVSGIEVISTTATVSAVDVSLASFGGVTTVQSVGSTAAVTYSNVQVIPVVNLNGTSSNLTVGMTAATVAGLADAMTINLSSVANSNTLAATTVTVNGIETITVDATGASGVGFLTDGVTPRSIFIGSDALRSLTVTGTGTAKIDALMSGATGTGTTGITATVTGSAGVDDFFITLPNAATKLSANLGTGNDSLFITGINAAQTINGGEGTDTLVYNGAAADATATANVTGFENVQLRAGVSFALATSNLTYTVAAGSSTYTGLAAGATVALQQGGTLTLANTALTGTTDAVTVTVGTATATSPVAATINAGTHDVVTVTGVARSDTLATTSAAINVSGTTLNTITLNSSQGVALTGGGAALTTINASGVAGAFSNAATVSSTAAVTITGGAGNDIITGGALADSLVGGAGADTITGGLGADTMTGGDGADVFVIAANTGVTADLAVSTSTITDTIIGFVSGTDRLQLGQTVSSFVGNVTNIQLGLAAMTAANQAFFVTSENTLYVVATFGTTAGTLSNTDTIVKLPGVATLSGADLAVGSTTGGTDLTTSAASAVSGQTGTTSNVGITALFTGSTSLNLTGQADTVRSTGTFLVGDGAANGTGVTLNGGNGTDTLAVTGGGTIDFRDVTNFETVTLGETTVSGATTTGYVLQVIDANIASGSTLTINASGTTTTTVNVDASAVTQATVGVATPRSVNITGGGSVTLVDTLIGGSGNDTISGGAGNDLITGGAGNDVLTGGDGDDTFNIAAGAGTDVITGGAGNDVLALTGSIGTSTTSLSSVDLGAGVNNITIANTFDLTNATISATGGVYGITLGGAAASMTPTQFSGAFQVIGTGGTVETLTFTTNGTVNVSAATTIENFTLSAGSASTGANSVTVGATAVTVNGAAGVDTFTASAAAAHQLVGGNGNDVFNMGTTLATTDVITGGDDTGTSDTLNFTDGDGATSDLNGVTGIETIVLGAAVSAFNSVQANVAATATLTINAAAATSLVFSGAAETDGGRFVITGSAGADNLTGGDGADTISGGATADTITGGSGNDSLVGDAGADTIDGGTGSDVISGGADADQITGGADSDSLTGGAGADRFRFGVSESTLGSLDVITDFRAATGDNASAVDVLELFGTEFLPGTVATIQDLSAQTSLGAALNAAANSNAVDGGLSAFVFGGNTYFYREAAQAGTSYVTTDFVLRVDGTAFGTTAALSTLTVGTTVGLVGTFGNDTLTGTAGADVITGGAGDDALSGAAGTDNISGGVGVDTITGGTGADTLAGGAGVDTFVFAAGDTGTPTDANFDIISDFATASDVIDHAAALTIVVNAAGAAVGAATISAAGIATFAGADDTLAERIVAVEGGIATGAATAGQTAAFMFGADAYMFISDGVDGVGANDVLIRLTGVDLATGAFDTLTIAGGNATFA